MSENKISLAFVQLYVLDNTAGWVDLQVGSKFWQKFSGS